MVNTINITGSVSRRAGGLFESVRRLVQELSLLPMEVTVLGTIDEFTSEDIQYWSPVWVHAVKPIVHKQFGYSPFYMKYLSCHRPDILHTHGLWTYAGIVTQRYCAWKKVPYLVSPHGMLDPWAIQNSHWKKRLAHHLFEARHLTQASCLRALCHSEAIDFKNYGLKNPICVIPNGIDLPSDQESGTGAGVSTRKTLLFLGRIHPKKGLANAIRAFAESRNFHADVRRSRGWRMVIAGWNQGGHQEELVELCQEIGLRYCILGDKPEMDAWKNMGEEIIFFGEVFGDRKKELLRSCDAFILPSLSEGLPMSVLEAWAYGMPVLITAECNLPEGYATQAAIRIESDASGIARGLDQLFSMSRSDLQAMGLRGRRLVQKRFAWKTVSSQMKEVYDWILGGGSSPECVIASEKLKIKYKKANQSSL